MKHKTRFANRELCHVWAQQTQEFGKGSSMFFEGNRIYSYGKHFEIARIVKQNTGYDGVILFNSASYSNTTAKHQAYVRYAIDYDTNKVFTVPYFGDIDQPYTLQLNIPWFIKNIKSTLEEAARSRKYKEQTLDRAQRIINDMFAFINEFNLEITAEAAVYQNMNLLSPEVMAELKEAETKRRANELKKKKEDIAAWLRGETKYLGKLTNVFLRVVYDEVETSLGAKVPMNEAKLLYSAIKANKPVHGIKIGYYTVNSYSNGILSIGCHKLHDSEINRFATAQGW